jgi:hypothetical protein
MLKSECAKIVLALSAIIIVTYAVTVICLPRKSHHKLLSTDESKVTFYVDAMYNVITLTYIVIFYWTDVAAFDVNPVFTVVT